MPSEELFLLALVCILYSPALRGPLLFDDHAIKEWRFAEGFPLFYRPEAWAPYWIFLSRERSFYHLICRWICRGKDDRVPARLFHAVNLGVHWLACCCLFWLLREAHWSYFHANLAALLFAVHPVAAASVAYISGLAGMMAVLFTLLALLHFQIGGAAHFALGTAAQFLAWRSKQEGFLYLAVYPIFFYWFG